MIVEAALAQELPNRESNLWPIVVQQHDATTDTLDRIDFAGPLISQDFEQERTITALRPFWVDFRSTTNDTIEAAHFLYPLFNYQRTEDSRSWDIFRLIRFRRDLNKDSSVERSSTFFPLYFNRQNSDHPEKSYRGLLPIAGSVRNKLGYDRISWTLFPFYSKWERGEETTRATPWPFFKIRRGGGSRGFHLWPLYGRMERPGDYRKRFWLWPFIYHHRIHMDREVPTTKFGVLPFYASEYGEGQLESRTWLWPFMGYTKREEPRFHQRRYLWPLWVVSRSDDKRLNRWLPFYSLMEHPNYQRRWLLWPLFRKARYQEGTVDVTRNQFFFYLYWSMRQVSIEDPEGPAARRTHLWPFFSLWDNGHGRRQFQLFSPLEVFFQDNDAIRHLYTPLFALYRSEKKAPDHRRIELLFRLLTYESNPDTWRFNLGPLLTLGKRRFELLRGLVGINRNREEKEFKFLWRQF